MAERLQKYLARCGLASRRHCEKLILDGRCLVNGQVAHLGQSIEPGQDQVSVDGRLVALPEQLAYWVLHKPVGYVTTVHDPQRRPTVMQLLPQLPLRLYPVGRLDLDSSGLLLLTNDGALTQRLLHPSSHIWKTYHCGLESRPEASQLRQLQQGILLEDGPTAPCRLRWLGDGCLEIQLREGRKRQIRRMLASLGHPVQWLRRVAFGPLGLGALGEGRSRPLSSEEIRALRG